jgi:hypothetical protein
MRKHRFVPRVDEMPLRIAPSTYGPPILPGPTDPGTTTTSPTSTDTTTTPAPVNSMY